MAAECRRCFGRLARGKYRDQAARAVKQLQVDGQIAQRLERGSLEQLVALDDDEDVELVRRESVA